MLRILKVLTAISTPVFLAACGGSGSTGQMVTGMPNPDISPGGYQIDPTMDASFGTLINGVRATNGVGALAYNAQLDQAAQGHAEDMLANGYFSHTGQNGSTVGTRVAATGYVATAVGENIARGQTSEQQVLNDWVGSPLHQANNVNAVFNEFGLGQSGSGSNAHWVLVFGAQ